jgi:hypothetical protein
MKGSMVIEEEDEDNGNYSFNDNTIIPSSLLPVGQPNIGYNRTVDGPFKQLDNG